MSGCHGKGTMAKEYEEDRVKRNGGVGSRCDNGVYDF